MSRLSNLRTIALSVLVFGALTACVPTVSGDSTERRGFLSGLERPERDNANLLRQRKLADGAVIVKAPKHYCVDPAVIGTAHFALIAECGTLQGAPAQHPQDRGILTVSISSPLTEGSLPRDLGAALGEGQRFDSRINGLTVKRITDARAQTLAGADPTHWRGALLLNERLVTFAVYGPENGAVLGDAGRVLLEELARNTQRSSRLR
ncbi:hypothetical protein N6L24_04730 [Cognatishimia sp. SS12]|uniref:hypothetical protein n=1 Tax=Cognatishimia sp. SS12 TaxID=2979465 RepID=UPI00232ECF8E|nr:hypothetical protein [Cognatishimia sp. SS12]MDC0737572.1 hypothetical protein [Cognatishimia sp. SS12]